MEEDHRPFLTAIGLAIVAAEAQFYATAMEYGLVDPPDRDTEICIELDSGKIPMYACSHENTYWSLEHHGNWEIKDLVPMVWHSITPDMRI